LYCCSESAILNAIIGKGHAREAEMRGTDEQQTILIVATTVDEMLPADHPVRRIRPVVEEALKAAEPALQGMYSKMGRPGVPPEHLLKASVLMALFSIRSERRFCEELRTNLVFKWFLRTNIDDLGFDHSTFSKNRERLLSSGVADQFFKQVVEQAQLRKYMSDDRFVVDGSLMEAWASIKSLKPTEGEGCDGPGGPVRGERLSNETHRSTTDPEARLMKKARGAPAKLSFLAEVMTESRNGLVVDIELVQASGTAERDTALELMSRQPRRRRKVAADKLYDTKDFVRLARALKVTPHVAQIKKRRGGSAIDGRTTRHETYAVSQRNRKRVEQVFSWLKTIGGCGKLRFLGQARNRIWILMSAATYNVLRISKLDAQMAV
jgi:transposase